MNVEHLQWWANLRHGGLMLDTQRLSNLMPELPEPLKESKQEKLRREVIAFQDSVSVKRSPFVSFVFENVCDFKSSNGSSWLRGRNIDSSWTRSGLAGEALRPNQLWIWQDEPLLPVFIDDSKRLGVGRGRRTISGVHQWLRKGQEQLAVVTNGFQWRLVFAGLDYEAFCEWDIGQWFIEGDMSPELLGLRGLINPDLWIPAEKKQPSPLLAAINDSRKGQAELSQVLGERVRQATEMLVQAHSPVLNLESSGLSPDDIYRAAVRMIMRLVVVLFAESRENLLPRDNPVYNNAYSLSGLREMLDRISKHRLSESYYAYPRILSLLRLIYNGTSHEAMPVPAYGGTLFMPGDPGSNSGMERALYILESACFGADIMNDLQVHKILDLLTRTKIKIRQGRSGIWIKAPVDFSCLDSEYIGILYEGLLDFELHQAAEDEPVIFLGVGHQPALPLNVLESMEDRDIKNLLEKLKDTSSSDDDQSEDDEVVEETEEDSETDSEDESEAGEKTTDSQDDDEIDETDVRYTLQTRALKWAVKACEIGGLVSRPHGRMIPEKQMQYDRALKAKADQLVVRTILPGEWYLVRWGGTRKGAGTFYTRPQLAVPTVHRTLHPLVHSTSPTVNEWAPKKPEDILSVKVCDPACGSGSFLLAAIRYLTDVLYTSLLFHDRVKQQASESILEIIFGHDGSELLCKERLPCRPDDDDFEVRTMAVLKRYVVERCIYGVDIDPLAVELCRLSIWIETIDPNLPMTFIRHKIKCGNSLVGAWFDQFLHYPVMAWLREGGDKTHSNGVHYKKEQWTKAIKDKKNIVKSDLIEVIDGGALFTPVDLDSVRKEHQATESVMEKIHSIGIAQVRERAEEYKRLKEDQNFIKLKDAFDLWCCLWFWPADQIDHAPLPSDFGKGEISVEAWNIVRRMAAEKRYFHWELEFPDVFNEKSSGFDASPWKSAMGNSPACI